MLLLFTLLFKNLYLVDIFMLGITTLGNELKTKSISLFFSLFVWYAQVSFSLIKSHLFFPCILHRLINCLLKNLFLFHT